MNIHFTKCHFEISSKRTLSFLIREDQINANIDFEIVRSALKLCEYLSFNYRTISIFESENI